LLIHAIQILLLLAHPLLQLAEHGGGSGELIHSTQARGSRLAERIERRRVAPIGADELPRAFPRVGVGAKLLRVAQVARQAAAADAGHARAPHAVHAAHPAHPAHAAHSTHAIEGAAGGVVVEGASAARRANAAAQRARAEGLRRRLARQARGQRECHH
jgi:hypothetical protein